MTVLMLIAAFVLGGVVGVWLTYNCLADRMWRVWREELERAVHPTARQEIPTPVVAKFGRQLW